MVSPFVSIIIPTYNRKNQLKKCLDSVLRIDYPKEKYEIIIIDDGSTDETYAFLKEEQSKVPNFKIFRQENKGCAAARNLGIKNAKGEILFFTDDDCLVEKDWTVQHLKHYSNEKVGGVGGILCPNKMNYIEEYKIAIYLDEYTQYMEVTDAKSGRGLATCNCSYRKEMFEITGLFDEDFITGADPEFSKRIMIKGYKIIKDPNIKVHHLKTDTFKSFLRTYFKRRQGITAERKKHENLWTNKKKYGYIKRLTNLWRRFCYVQENITDKRIDIYIMIKFLFLISCLAIVGKLGDFYYGIKAR